MSQSTKEKIYLIYQTKETGLTAKEARKRLEKYGFNEIKSKKRQPLIYQFFEEFKNFMVIILLVAVVIAFISGEKTDAIIIAVIILINTCVGFLQKYKTEKALEALKKLVSLNARIIREGKEMQIEAKYLVPGDIIVLNEGDRVSADAKILKEHELLISESILTGESSPVKKYAEKYSFNDENAENSTKKAKNDEHSNIVFMGTTVTSGTAKCVVMSTGMDTQFGKIAHLTISTKKDKSPLQKELDSIAILAGKITLILAGILLIVTHFLQKKPFIETFLFSISVAVAAVPEGLPATITVALALGVERLTKKNAIIKQLASIETLGSTNVICSDKTGTLTKNEMTVREIMCENANFFLTGSGYDPMEGTLLLENDKLENIESASALKNLQKEHPSKFFALELLCRAATLCNNGNITDNEETPERDISVLGDPTEGCLLTMTSKAGFDTQYIKHQSPRIYELLFDSQRKMMTTLHLHGKKIIAYTKGAPDHLLEKCGTFIMNGKIVPLTQKLKEKMLKENEQMTNRALRVLGFAFRELAPIRKKNYTKEEVEKNLTFIGLAGMIDPPRTEVKEAIRLTKEAGIKVYIVTGDYGNTALAIAKEIGLIDAQNEAVIITGTELQTIDTINLKKTFEKHKNIIFARVNPQHKLKIVNTLKEMNLVVAVTGDGVNDAPALKRADIGIAMGITGTDVSKEAANMILSDDSFATIVTAIKEGRNIYENLKKCIMYTFACNIGELIMVFSAIMMNLPTPLTAILILSVNMGTDVLPALALGVDPPEENIMKLAPRKHENRILNRNYIAHFSMIGIFIGGIVTAMFIYTLIENGWNWGIHLTNDDPIYLKASTVAFAFLVLIQMVQAFNARSKNQSLFKLGIFSNKHLVGAVLISILMLFAFVHLPIMQNFVHTVDLTLKEWGLIIAGSLSIFVIEEIRKIITKKLKRA